MEYVNVCLSISTLNNVKVRDVQRLGGVEVSIGVRVGPRHLNELAREVLLQFDGLPSVVDVYAIDPKFRRLLWVELSSKERILFGFDRSNEGSAVGHEAFCSHVPETIEPLISLESLGRNTVSVTVVSHVLLLELVGIWAKTAVHLGFHRFFQELERKAHMVKVEDAP